jgi:hypothetical protein
MRVAYLKGEPERPKPAKPPVKSKKEISQEKVDQWIMAQKARDRKKAMKFFEKEIAEIRIKNPNFLK